MNKYQIIIKFADRDEIQARVSAVNQGDALARLLKDERVIEFLNKQNGVKSIDFKFLGEDGDIEDNDNRFSLVRSNERDGWWVAADSHTNMVMMFKEGNFPKCVEIKPLEDMTPLDTATAIRELGDWLRLYHSDLI